MSIKNKSKIPICILLIALVTLSPILSSVTNAAVTEGDLISVLQKFCIPKDENNCNPNGLAKYNAKTNSCQCNTNGYYWSVTNRKCIKVVCPTGYHAVYSKTPSGCPSGTKYSQTISCPKGTIIYGKY